MKGELVLKLINIKDVYNKNLFILKLVWKYYKLYVIASITICFSSILTPLGDILAPKYIIDFIEQRKPFRCIILVVLGVFSIESIKSLYYSWYNNYLTPHAQNIVKSAINCELMKKASLLDLECYENPNFYDKYTRALKEADSRAISVVISLKDFLLSLTYLLTLVGIVAVLDPFLIIISIISMLISSFFGFVTGKYKFKYEQQLTPYEKHLNYIKRIFYEVQYSKEIRIFSLKDILLKKYKKNTGEIDDILKHRGLKLSILNILDDVSDFVMSILVLMLYLAWKIYNGVLTVGDFMALLIACRQLTSRLQSFSDTLTQFYEHSFYIDNLKELLNYKSKIETTTEPCIKFKENITSIDIENLSFSYAENKVLNDVTIKVSKGEKIAIVGRNGAGKSTLVKLILRLYDADSGRILINGDDITKFSISSLREYMGLVFQDFQLYAASIAENILLRDTFTLEDENEIWYALEQVGLDEKIRKLPKGIYTLITKEFSNDGTFFSGGEAQKLVLARIFVKNYDVVILDEPSSALDPLAEKQMYENMMDITKDKIAIFITHRLSTTVMSDRIYLFDRGRIIEQGTHNELMNINGQYKKMFNAQAQYYVGSKADQAV